MSAFGEDLVQSLSEALAHAKGEGPADVHKGRVGSSFEDHLAAQGILEETNAVAVKRVLAWQTRRAKEGRADEEESDGRSDVHEP